MTDDSVKVEIWKKIVDVQQHFNDLELRIRNFALAVAGAFLGLGASAIKDGGFTSILGFHVSVSGVVVLAAIFPVLAFYFMDRLWYHRLLDGSVIAGIAAEKELTDAGYKVDLGTAIKSASPFMLFGKPVHSKNKMDMFYSILIVSLLLVSALLAFGVREPAKENGSVSKEKAGTELAQPKEVRPTSTPTTFRSPSPKPPAKTD